MNSNPPQKRGLTAIDGAMVLIVILLIVQIWLLSATLNRTWRDIVKLHYPAPSYPAFCSQLAWRYIDSSIASIPKFAWADSGGSARLGRTLAHARGSDQRLRGSV